MKQWSLATGTNVGAMFPEACRAFHRLFCAVRSRLALFGAPILRMFPVFHSKKDLDSLALSSAIVEIWRTSRIGFGPLKASFIAQQFCLGFRGRGRFLQSTCFHMTGKTLRCTKVPQTHVAPIVGDIALLELGFDSTRWFRYSLNAPRTVCRHCVRFFYWWWNTAFSSGLYLLVSIFSSNPTGVLSEKVRCALEVLGRFPGVVSIWEMLPLDEILLFLSARAFLEDVIDFVF
mmetsp:Transcript_27541/g.53509  ORF Transcript_27541/g.53509 Transcript_27541/m.53509 type:complete len:232 (-) Transcript_27541:51-746(-)